MHAYENCCVYIPWGRLVRVKIKIIVDIHLWHRYPTGVSHRASEDDYYEGYYIPKGISLILYPRRRTLLSHIFRRNDIDNQYLVHPPISSSVSSFVTVTSSGQWPTILPSTRILMNSDLSGSHQPKLWGLLTRNPQFSLALDVASVLGCTWLTHPCSLTSHAYFLRSIYRKRQVLTAIRLNPKWSSTQAW